MASRKQYSNVKKKNRMWELYTHWSSKYLERGHFTHITFLTTQNHAVSPGSVHSLLWTQSYFWWGFTVLYSQFKLAAILSYTSYIQATWFSGPGVVHRIRHLDHLLSENEETFVSVSAYPALLFYQQHHESMNSLKHWSRATTPS